jgi:16S rRNA (cytidine1402-2'-O)-methyltransferase
LDKGKLFLVATPIGNLGDITKRAIDVLSAVDVVAAEDTRHTLRLLNSLGLKKTLISFHEHSKKDRADAILEILQEGRDIALVSDAGTPLISDPGCSLVSRAAEEGFEVIPIPGACAPIAALIISGLNTERFVFEGFLPRDGAARKKALGALAREERTAVILESPYRLKDTIKDFCESFGGERRAAVCRELTKVYEQAVRGTLAEIAAYFEGKDVKGEIVIVLEGATILEQEADEETVLAVLQDFINNGGTKKDAVGTTADLLKLNKNKVYRILNKVKTNENK